MKCVNGGKPQRELCGFLQAVVCIVFICLGTSLIVTSKANAASAEMRDRVSRQIIIKLKNQDFEFSSQSNANRLAAPGLQRDKVLAAHGLRLLKSMSLKAARNKPSRNNARESLKPNNSAQTELVTSEWMVVEATNSKVKRKDLMAALNRSDAVDFAVADSLLYASGLPSDPLFSSQWGLHNVDQLGGVEDIDVNAPEAWDLIEGAQDIVVAVLDTGIRYDHPDLAPNMWVNPGEAGGLANNGVDDDNNGYIDDVHGIDCFNNDSDPLDDDISYHGTHVSGILGARGDNARQISGVAKRVKIMALKHLNANGVGTVSSVVECLAYALNMRNQGVNLRITNNSYGGTDSNPALKAIIKHHAQADILFVAAAGNGGENTDFVAEYPASYDNDNIISVSNINRQGLLAVNSNYGENTVDIAAPGTDILSTINDDETGTLSGTSMSSPHVAGIAALIFAQHPNFSFRRVKNLILDTAKPLGTLEDKVVSGGIANAYAALICDDSSFKVYFDPVSKVKYLANNRVHRLSLRLSSCGVPLIGKNVLVTPSNGQSTFGLTGDGNGRYYADWQPTVVGDVTLTVQVDGLNKDIRFSVVEVPEYRIDQSHAYNWLDISDTGTELVLEDEFDEAKVDLGFEFSFFGVPYRQAYVHGNGMLKFGYGMELNSYAEIVIGDSSRPNNFIAALWENLNPSLNNGRIFSQMFGVAPHRKLVVQWHELTHARQTFNFLRDTVSFQAVLYESSNDIVLQYKAVEFGSGQFDGGASSTIGIKGFDGRGALEHAAGSERKVSAEQAIRFTFTGLDQRTLSIQPSSFGTVEDHSGAIFCQPDCFARYDRETQIVLTAIPQPGYIFEGWSGLECADTGSSICEFILSDHLEVAPIFGLAPVIEIDGGDKLITSESGLRTQFNLRLNRRPTSDVTLRIFSSNTDEGVLLDEIVVFTPENALQGVVIEVVGVDDLDQDGDTRFTIESDDCWSEDSVFDDISMPILVVTNRDNDSDSDDDGVLDDVDNCRLTANVQQIDSDGDQQGNACDLDDDNDGLNDDQDLCPLVKGDCANGQETDSLCFPIKSSTDKVVLICL